MDMMAAINQCFYFTSVHIEVIVDAHRKREKRAYYIMLTYPQIYEQSI